MMLVVFTSSMFFSLTQGPCFLIKMWQIFKFSVKNSAYVCKPSHLYARRSSDNLHPEQTLQIWLSTHWPLLLPQQEAPFQGCNAEACTKKGAEKGQAEKGEAYITWRKSCPLAPSRKDGRKSVRRWGMPNQRERAPIQWILLLFVQAGCTVWCLWLVTPRADAGFPWRQVR